jgi:hypothetical protein
VNERRNRARPVRSIAVKGVLRRQSSEERVVYKRLNSTGTLIQRTTTEGPQRTLCITSGWMFTRRRYATASRMRAAGPSRRQDRSHATRTGWLDQDCFPLERGSIWENESSAIANEENQHRAQRGKYQAGEMISFVCRARKYVGNAAPGSIR